MKTKATLEFQPLYYFKKHQKLRSALSVLLTLALLNLITGCSYYRLKTVPQQDYAETAQQIKAFNEAQKYIVLHKNNASLHLENPVVNEDNLELSGTVTMLSEEHTAKRQVETKRSYRYKPGLKNPLNEVHIYLKEGEPLSLSYTVIPFSEIEEMGIAYSDGTTSIVHAALGTLGALVLILAIYAALKSSCPFIYVKNGNEYVFSGELYPGNIIKNAQETDYLPLPALKETDGKLNIRITNELLEIQHTDLAQLMEISHPKNTTALADKKGQILLYSDLESPVNAFLDGTINNLEPALTVDASSYMFDTPVTNSDNTRNVVLTFTKPTDAHEAKLFLRAKNSLWLDYVFGKFNQKFGSYYNTFQKSQQESTKEEALAWSGEQHIPLTVSVKRKGVWKEVEKLASVGPLSFRDLGIKLDLQGIEEDVVEIKLETGYMFWEVDYVGIDYSEELPFEIKLLDPVVATTNTGEDVAHLLASQDGQYLTQKEIGDAVEISYLPTAADKQTLRSYFLKNRGYYTYIRDYEGIPDFTELQKFRNPGTFTRFSENEYHRTLKVLQLKEASYVVQ